MDYIVLCLFFYAVLTVTDLFPLIRRKQWNYLWFFIPIFVITLLYHFLSGMNMQFPSLAELLQKIYPGS